MSAQTVTASLADRISALRTKRLDRVRSDLVRVIHDAAVDELAKRRQALDSIARHPSNAARPEPPAAASVWIAPGTPKVIRRSVLKQHREEEDRRAASRRSDLHTAWSTADQKAAVLGRPRQSFAQFAADAGHMSLVASAGPAPTALDDEEVGAARLEGCIGALAVLPAGGNPLDSLALGPSATPIEVERVEGAVRLLERLL